MSKRGMERARRRLDRLEEDMGWALGVMSDPEEAQRTLDLTHAELDELFDDVHASLLALHAAITAALTAEMTRFEVEGRAVTLVGPLPPKLRATREARVTMVGPVVPRRRTLVGPVVPHRHEVGPER